MAINYDRENNEYSHIGVPFNYTRGNPLPLDNSSVWTSYLSAEEYAKNSPVAYVGQLITVSSDSTIDAYVIENESGSLKKLASGGSTDEIMQKLTSLSVDVYTKISTDLDTLEGEVSTIKETTIPELSSSLKSGLTVTVIASAGSGSVLSSYTLSQGGSEIGKIEIPKDKVIEKASVVKFATDEEAREATGDPTAKAGTYLKLQIQNQEKALYVPVPDLAQVYQGHTSDTIKLDVVQKSGEEYTISATVVNGSIGAQHLTSGLSTYIGQIRTDVNTVSTDIATEVTNRETAITQARTDLSAYGKELSANAYTQAKSYTDTSIGGLTASIDAGKSGDAQKVFTKITQNNGVVDGESMQLAVKDINGLSTAIEQVESNAKSYTDGKLDALDWTNNIASTQRVKSIDQTDGKITVVAEDMHLSNMVNYHNEITADLANTFDAKGAASTAESNAKKYTDDLSVVMDKKIEDAEKSVTDLSAELKGDVKNAREELSAYVDTEVASEKTAREGAVTTLSVELKGDISTEKTRAEGIESSLRTDLNTVSSDLDTLETTVDTFINTTYPTDKTELEGKITTARSDLSAYVDKKVGDEETARTTAIRNLSVEVIGKISDEETRAKGVEDAIKTDVSTISSDVVSHGTRITTAESDIKDLSSKVSGAMHFKGVATTELSTGSTITPIPPYKTGESPKDGDVVITLADSKEFVWAESKWNEIGAEGIWATKASLEAEADRAKASESVLSGMVSTEETRAKGVESGLITSVESLSATVGVFISTTYPSDKAALEAKDSEISGKVDNKVKVGTGTWDVEGLSATYNLENKTSLSVVKIADEDYYKLVAEGKEDKDIIYIVSSDYVNGHDQRIINVGSAISATDAVNLSGMNAAIDAAKQEIVANSLSGVSLNGQSFTVTNNIAELTISCINCGNAD